MPISLQGNQMNNLNVATASITAPVNVVATSSATGTTCMTSGIFNAPFTGTYMVEIFVPQLTKGTTNLDLELFSGASAAAGTFLQTLTGHMVASSILGAGCVFVAIVSLTAGANQLTVTGFVDAGTGVFGAGAGTTGALPPARLIVSST